TVTLRRSTNARFSPWRRIQKPRPTLQSSRRRLATTIVKTAVKPIVIDPKKELVVRNSAGLLQPLRVPAFRNLLIADLVSDVGTVVQSVGAAWSMVSLHAGPGYVALLQASASRTYPPAALPAGPGAAGADGG